MILWATSDAVDWIIRKHVPQNLLSLQINNVFATASKQQVFRHFSLFLYNL